MAAKLIIVFPFENHTQNPSMEWISESFVETLNQQLASADLSPISQDQRNGAYDLLGLPYEGNFSHATFIKVGEELDANFSVLGSYRLENSTFSATAQLINLDTRRMELELTEQGPLDTLKRLQSRLVWRILTHFDSSFPYSQEEFYKRFGEVPLSAFENYVRGRQALDSKSQLQYFLKAERLFPNYPKAIFQIGKIYFQQKDYATSQLWLRRLAKTDSHFYEATFYLGLDYYFLNSFEKSASAFAQLAAEIPLNEVFNDLAVTLSRLGKSSQVVRNFQKAIEGDPGEPDFYFNLGYYYWKSGEYASAAKYFREALQLNPGDAEASYLLAQSLQNLKPGEENARFLHLDARLNPKTATSTAASMPALERIKINYDAAAFRELKATLDQLNKERLKRRPHGKEVAVHLGRGKELFEGLRNEEAFSEFSQALELDAGSSEAYFFLGRIYERQGKFEEAIRALRTAVRLRNSAEAQVVLGHLYFTLDQLEEATQAIAEALTLDPDNREARELKGLLEHTLAAAKKPVK